MDLLKREWKVLREIWKSLKNDSIEQTYYYCVVSGSPVHGSPVSRTNMGIAKQETLLPATSSQSVPAHL